ncbi:YolD-like family protein, partial [Peribacillus muralis]|uniref:YolD-like family protein n=1 Tax=Peribacillus muralis TaxID=264697 RepID=UPI003CFD6BD3
MVPLLDIYMISTGICFSSEVRNSPFILPAPFHIFHFIRTIVPFQVVSEQTFVYNDDKGDVSMNKDRGNIKWQSSFMLPEHVKFLRGWAEEDKFQTKPILDEQELDLISTIAMDS